MSSTGDKVKGMANEAVGNIKQGVGKATDNDRLHAEGKVQEKKAKPSKPLAMPRTRSRKASTRRNRALNESPERPSKDGRFCIRTLRSSAKGSPSRLP